MRPPSRLRPNRQMRTPPPRLQRNRPGRSRANRAASPTGPGSDGPKGLGVHAVQLIGRKVRLLRRQFAARGRQLRPRLAMAPLRALGQPARTIDGRPHRAQHFVKMGLFFRFYARGSSIGTRIGICACRPKQCSASTAFSFLIQVSRNADGSALAGPRPGNLRGRSREMRRRQGETLC